MQRFIPAAELQQSYGVFGHFYSVQLDSGEIVECRSVLELVAKSQIPRVVSKLSDRSPDALFIMMNPGSSKPLVEVHNRVRVAAIDKLAVSLVPTRPDTTQYQLMRLMCTQHWSHVRVLNLSDVRSPKSVEFFRTFQRLERDQHFEAHSVFSQVRGDELAKKLPSSRKAPLVLAWGLSEKLDPLIQRCLASLPPKRTLKGLRAEGTIDKYRHPLPSLHRDQRVWVENMQRQLES